MPFELVRLAYAVDAGFEEGMTQEKPVSSYSEQTLTALSQVDFVVSDHLLLKLVFPFSSYFAASDFLIRYLSDLSPHWKNWQRTNSP